MENSEYQWKKTVNYQTHEEYQDQLVSVMTMIDEGGGHIKVLDDLYENTKNDVRIMELCRLASEKCLLHSEAEYGQVLLFSYDCFAKFHVILQWFFNGGIEENGLTEEIVNANYDWLHDYFVNNAKAHLNC